MPAHSIKHRNHIQTKFAVQNYIYFDGGDQGKVNAKQSLD